VIGCPLSFVDCGTCRCVPASTCQWCPGGSLVSLEVRPEEVDPSLSNAVVPAGRALSLTETLEDVTPSTIVGCPALYVDCGTCRCVPRATCRWCGSTTEPELNVTLPVPGTNFTARPSEIPYCPARFVDCGGCRCVPFSTCQWCPQSDVPASNSTNATVQSPSLVPGCPSGYVDCGTCRCVPESTCQWCPGGSGQPQVPSRPQSNVTSRPSVIPFCPANYKDCGSCLCVPESTCQWCPGAGTSPVVQPPQNVTMHPSEVIGCPASFVDCGTCRCVPEHTCRWCAGWSPATTPTTGPAETSISPSTTTAGTTLLVTTVVTTEPPQTTVLQVTTPPASSTSSVSLCPQGYVFCISWGCVRGSTCDFHDEYGYAFASSDTPDDKTLRI